jgi:Ni/Co efflux regulator RcnB
VNSELPFEGDRMKKLLTVVFTMLLAGSLAFAQNTGGDKAKGKENPTESNKTAESKAHKGGKKGHKGGKKGKKSSGGTTTPPPK